MKILNINRFYYCRGGTDTYYFQVADILRENGHIVIPFSCRLNDNIETPYSEYFVRGFSEESFPYMNIIEKAKIFFNCIYSLEAKKNLIRLIETERLDIAHIHSLFYQLSISVISALKKKNIPIVMSLHDYGIVCGSHYLYRSGNVCELCKGNKHKFLLINRCYRETFLPSLMAYLAKKVQRILKIIDAIDTFTVPQEDMKNRMVEFGIPKDKIRIIHSPFKVLTLSPNYVFKDYILFYGRIVHLKGIFTILRAMEKLPNIKLKIYGSGTDYEKVVEYISVNKMKNVEINPFLRWGSELIEGISNARFVISAPEWYTLNDYVVYESFALGKPVIGSSIGGNKFMIREGYNGLLYPPGNADILAQKIEELFYDNDRIMQMGKDARHFVETELNYERFYEKLLSIYREVLQGR